MDCYGSESIELYDNDPLFCNRNFGGKGKKQEYGLDSQGKEVVGKTGR
jgi:hypothetical protein